MLWCGIHYLLLCFSQPPIKSVLIQAADSSSENAFSFKELENDQEKNIRTALELGRHQICSLGVLTLKHTITLLCKIAVNVNNLFNFVS